MEEITVFQKSKSENQNQNLILEFQKGIWNVFLCISPFYFKIFLSFHTKIRCYYTGNKGVSSCNLIFFFLHHTFFKTSKLPFHSFM